MSVFGRVTDVLSSYNTNTKYLVAGGLDISAWMLHPDSDSDKLIQQKYMQAPYQVYISFSEMEMKLVQIF